jgi:molybdopterin biosynthesis enzyme
MPRPLIELDSARRIVLEQTAPLEPEDVALESSLGRILAEDVSSSEAVPGFDNSAMDGFAVRARDTDGASVSAPAVLQLVDESRAGRPFPCVPGACATPTPIRCRRSHGWPAPR